jgi:hypothetical protein
MNDKQPQGAPAEPMTPTAEAWAMTHEMYLGMRAAGFTLIEAAAIIAATIMHGQGGKPDQGK